MLAKHFKNVFRGVGSVLVILPAPALEADSPVQIATSDVDALAKDWMAVGSDLKIAMKFLAHEQETAPR